MEWVEVDFGKTVWTLPGGKIKMRQPHAVPLSQQASPLLTSMRELTGKGKYVFPSIRTRSRLISDNTINAALRRMGYSKEQMTAHGFRTSASSLLNESGKWNPDAIERALAHMVAGSVRRIYNQSVYWPERVALAPIASPLTAAKAVASTSAQAERVGFGWSGIDLADKHRASPTRG